MEGYLALIKEQREENERLKELCDKYEEEHSTKFNEWVFDKRENERLNNVINGLEKYLIKVIETSSKYEQITCKYVLKYLRELKEGK